MTLSEHAAASSPGTVWIYNTATSFCCSRLITEKLDYYYAFWHYFSCNMINNVVVCLFVNTYTEFCLIFLFKLSLTQMKYKYKYQIRKQGLRNHKVLLLFIRV